MTFRLFLVLITLLSCTCHCQGPAFVQLSIEDGLTTNTVYECTQDNLGYLWFCTDHGITMYNGISFYQYDKSSGLTSQEIFGLFEDSYSRKWLRTSNGTICYLANHKVKRIDISLKSPGYISSFFEDKSGKLWVGFERGDIISIDLQTLKVYDHYSVINTRTSKKFTIRGFIEIDNRVKIITSIGLYDIESNQISYYGVTLNGLLKIDHSGNLYFVNDSILGYYNASKKLMSKSSHRVTGSISLELLNNQVWIGTWNGLFKWDPQKDRLIKSFDNHSISGVCRDTYNSIWLSTLSHGLIYIPDTNVKIIRPPGFEANEFNVSHLFIDYQDRIWVGSYHGKISILDKHLMPIDTIDFKLKDSRGKIQDIASTRNDKIIFVATDEALFVSSSLGKKWIRYSFRKAPKCIQIDESRNQIYLGTSNGLYKADLNDFKKNGTRNYWSLILPSRVEVIEPIDSNHFLLGSIFEVAIYNQNTGKKEVFCNGKLNNLSVTDIIKLSEDRILISTSGDGLFLINNREITHITEKNGLLSNYCNSLTLSENFIYVGTSKGVISYNLKSDPQFTSPIVLKSLKGYVSSVIESNQTEVWAGASNGIYIVNPVQERRVEEVPLYIKHIFVNGKKRTDLRNIHLDYFENQLVFEYDAPYFKSRANIQYRYKLGGLENTWHYTSLERAEYPYLSPGTYSFQVQLLADDKIVSEKTLDFNVLKPYWQSYWFYVLLMLLVAVTIFLVVKMVLKNYKRKEHLKRKIAQLRLNALRAQMNPHFIFNCLNSIQRIYIEGDKSKANQYMANFSSLLRNILDNAEKQKISLAEELRTLKLYCDLESLRCGDKVAFNINVDVSLLSKTIYIPPFIIQPFVENAIWHGILPSGKAGTVSVNMKSVGDDIVCAIIDDGVGFNLNKSENPSSKGIRLTEERLGKKVSIQKIKSGTKIEFNIPYDKGTNN